MLLVYPSHDLATKQIGLGYVIGIMQKQYSVRNLPQIALNCWSAGAPFGHSQSILSNQKLMEGMWGGEMNHFFKGCHVKRMDLNLIFFSKHKFAYVKKCIGTVTNNSCNFSNLQIVLLCLEREPASDVIQLGQSVSPGESD